MLTGLALMASYMARHPVRFLAAGGALYLIARLALPAAFFEVLGLAALEATLWGVFGPTVVAAGVFELGVLVSAVLDYRDAKLVVVGIRQAWAVAHITVLKRVWRRACWIGTGIRRGWTLLAAEVREGLSARAEERDYVQLDPTQPFHGRVLEHEDLTDEDRKDDAA